MRQPEECRTLAEVRHVIDAIDRNIVAQLGERYRYVKAAASFKTSAEAVADRERQEAVIAAQRAWAKEEGLEPDLVEKLYRELLRYFVARKLKEWQSPEPL